jgi:hypothetical protein
VDAPRAGNPPRRLRRLVVRPGVHSKEYDSDCTDGPDAAYPRGRACEARARVRLADSRDAARASGGRRSQGNEHEQDRAERRRDHLRVLRANAVVGDEPLVRLAPKQADYDQKVVRGDRVHVVGGAFAYFARPISYSMVERLTPAIDHELRLLWAEETEKTDSGAHRETSRSE